MNSDKSFEYGFRLIDESTEARHWESGVRSMDQRAGSGDGPISSRSYLRGVATGVE